MSSANAQARVDELPLGPGVHVLEANEDGLVALDKPAGVMSHPNRENKEDRSLLRARYDAESEIFEWEAEGETRRAWLINRLDSPTSGVILVGLDEALSAEVKRQFASHKVIKTYYAVVKGKPSQASGTWADRLAKHAGGGTRKGAGAKRVPAKTRYKVVRTPAAGYPVALLHLSPLTGRTHQLRIQCGKHGHPVVGDRTYGSFRFNREVAQSTGDKRMFLHSAETRVNYAHKGKQRHFVAKSPMPDAFHRLLAHRQGHYTQMIRRQGKASRPTPGPRSVSQRLARRRFRR